ncbi:MAG TPA: hypothetical protein PLL77_16225 [Pyrinomonadaceae bacterium]|nr:hypothetical protein [Pyrinomonadaceae bacterium]
MATDRERNVADMFDATLAFDGVHASEYASMAAAAAAFARIQTARDNMETYFAQQESGESQMATEQKSLLKVAARRRMQAFARTAKKGLSATIPGIGQAFDVPDGKNEAVLVAKGRDIVTEAAKYEAEFAALGLPKAKREELTDLLDQIEDKAMEQDSKQQEKVGASAGIDAAVDDGMEAADLADVMMRNFYADDTVTLAEWKSARHIKRAPTKTKTPPIP